MDLAAVIFWIIAAILVLAALAVVSLRNIVHSALALVLVFVNGALTGRFYSHGRGGPPKLIASVKSFPFRIFFLVVAACLFAWLIVDLRHKL